MQILKRTIICLLAGLMLLSCNMHRQDGRVVVTGKARGLADGDTVVACLFHFDGETGRSIMRDTLHRGRFRFVLDTLPAGGNKFSIELFSGFRDILCLGPRLYLEPGANVRIKGLGRHYYTARITSPVKDQKLRQHFIRRMSRDVLEKHQDIYVDREAVINKREYDKSITVEERDSLYRLSSAMLKQMDSLSEIIARQDLELMFSEPPGQFWMERLRSKAKGLSYGYYKKYRPVIEKLYEGLPAELKESPEGMEIEDYLFPVKKVHAGDVLPDYKYVDISGSGHSVSEFRGRIVLLDFWTLGCTPCMESMPVLNRLNNEYGDRLSIISINLNTGSLWEQGRKEHPVSWTEWRDPKGSAGVIRSFESRGVPTFVLVSPEGVVLDVLEGFSEAWLNRVADI